MKHVFYHRDLDGLASYLVYSSAHNEIMLANSIQYGEPVIITENSNAHEIVFLDFTPEVSDVERILNNCSEVRQIDIFDHHRVSVTIKQIQDSIETSNTMFDRQIKFNPHIDTKAKGAVGLVLDYFTTQGNERLTRKTCSWHKAIRMIGCADVWDFTTIEGTKEFVAGLNLLNPFPLSDTNTVGWARTLESMCPPYPSGLNETIRLGGYALAARYNRVKNSGDRATTVEFYYGDKHLFNCPFVMATENISEIGNYLAEKNEERLGCVGQIIDGKLVLSFRSVGEGEIALEAALSFCGNGHPNAAGATCKNFKITDYEVRVEDSYKGLSLKANMKEVEESIIGKIMKERSEV